jgi:hypothetical protein
MDNQNRDPNVGGDQQKQGGSQGGGGGQQSERNKDNPGQSGSQPGNPSQGGSNPNPGSSNPGGGNRDVERGGSQGKVRGADRIASPRGGSPHCPRTFHSRRVFTPERSTSCRSRRTSDTEQAAIPNGR